MRIARTYQTQHKENVVLFSRNYAKILINPPGIEFYKRRANAIVNFPLVRMQNVPMQYWKKQGDTIVAMNAMERVKRDFDIEVNGVDRDFETVRLAPRTSRIELTLMVSLNLNLLTALYVLSRLIYG